MAACYDSNGNSIQEYSCNYSHLDTPNGALHHCGDNLTGEGEGDDVVIQVDLTKLPKNIASVSFFVTIYESKKRGQHFGMVQNAFIRLVNMKTNKELCRYTLDNSYGGLSRVIMGYVSRIGNEWQ